MLRVLAFQTRTIPSSDPDINKFPAAPYAKQVTALLLKRGNLISQTIFHSLNQLNFVTDKQSSNQKGMWGVTNKLKITKNAVSAYGQIKHF